jgi:hypothetical protein
MYMTPTRPAPIWLARRIALAAGQGVGAAVEGQVVEADVDQELQALADFLEDLVAISPRRPVSVRSPK